MRAPNPKLGNKLIPEQIALVLPFLYHGAFEGRNFQKAPEECPKCNAPVKPYDWTKRVYVRVLDLNGQYRNLYVNVRRFKCPEGHISQAIDAFYPDCRYGKRIVDLILYLGANNTFNAVEKYLADLRIQVDRDTVRKYFQRFGERAAQLAGIKVLGEDQAVNVLKLLFGLETVEELKKKHPGLDLDSQGDETFPKKKGALKKYRKELARSRREGKPPPENPEAFTVAMTSLPSIDVVPSVAVFSGHITDIQGTALKYPIRGSNYTLTDGAGVYARWPNRVPDLFHEARNQFSRFRGDLPEGQPLDEETIEKFKEEYQAYKSQRIEELGRKYPEYLDEEGNFTGPVGMGAIEGLNSRLHYFLGVPYKILASILGRIMAYLLVDSIFTFRKGKPIVSFAHREGTFSWEQVMEISSRKKKTKISKFKHWDCEKGGWYIS